MVGTFFCGRVFYHCGDIFTYWRERLEAGIGELTKTDCY